MVGGMSPPLLRWPPLPSSPALGAGEVLLVCAPLDLPAPLLAALGETLDSEERKRAERFYTAELRGRFTAGRGLLRRLLGQATATDPAALRFNIRP